MYLSKNLTFLRKSNNVNQTQLSDLVGKARTTIGNWESGISEPNLSESLKICQFFNISMEELLIKDLANTHLIEKSEVQNIDKNAHLNTHLSTHLNQVNEPQEAYGLIKPIAKNISIPLVDFRASAGFGNGAFAIEEQDIKSQYVIPALANKKVDFMITVEGSSMYPKYNSGDIIACSVIKSSYIQWNKAHLIATKDQGLLVKRIKKGSNDQSFLLVSDNPSYDPFEIPKDEITGLALVVGVFRLE